MLKVKTIKVKTYYRQTKTSNRNHIRSVYNTISYHIIVKYHHRGQADQGSPTLCFILHRNSMKGKFPPKFSSH